MLPFSLPPFFRRFLQYSVVGVGTYLIDIFLIYLFKTFLHFPDPLAIGLGFLIAVSINFTISYHWVFRGTEQSQSKGYLFFIGIACFGLLVIVSGTLAVQKLLNIDVYTARTIVAGLVGVMNYLLNSILNFKMTT